MKFLITNLVLMEIFFLIKPGEIKINLGKLVSTEAIYYLYFLPSGIGFIDFADL